MLRQQCGRFSVFQLHIENKDSEYLSFIFAFLCAMQKTQAVHSEAVIRVWFETI